MSLKHLEEIYHTSVSRKVRPFEMCGVVGLAEFDLDVALKCGHAVRLHFKFAVNMDFWCLQAVR